VAPSQASVTFPWPVEPAAGPVLLKAPGSWGTIVKSASEMSKKMFPNASILILAVVVSTFGSETGALPSLGVPNGVSADGNVCPPSVDSRMRTFVA
jgi:hypothetical protein